MNRNTLLVVAFGFATVASLPAELAPLNEHIAVSATAAPDYQRVSDGAAGLRPESYIFTPGRFFEGGTRDAGLERMQFNDLARKLAPDLARQKYYPARNTAAADIVIVVHWGASQTFDDPQRDANLDALRQVLPAYVSGIEDTGYTAPGPLNEISSSLEWSQDNSARALARNAVLLGYARDLGKLARLEGGLPSEREKTLRAELSEERYFVVLMAYDYQAMKKNKTTRLLWTTRLSVRTPGNNFTEALPVLSQAGSHVYGRQLEDIVHLRANLREGRVSLGNLKFLGVVEDAPADQKTQ